VIVPERIRALIVDDNAYARAVTGAILRTLGIGTIVEADGGAEALALLSSETFDVMFMDWYMPEITGAGLLQVVRDPRFGRAQGLQIILMTGYATRENVAQARKLGVNEVLTKPFTAQHALIALGQVLKGDWGMPAAEPRKKAVGEDDQFFL
jgi:two-component system, chemotaxis family, chemotaxis protein CheY